MHSLTVHRSHHKLDAALPIANRTATRAAEQIPPLVPRSPEGYIHEHDVNFAPEHPTEPSKPSAKATDDHDRGIRSRHVEGHCGCAQTWGRRRGRFHRQAAVLHGDPARYAPGDPVGDDQASTTLLCSWLAAGMTGCQFARLIAQRRDRLVAAAFPGLVSEADVSRVFETGTDTHLPALAVFTGIRTEAALIEQLSVLARAPRWRITREHPAGLITDDVMIGVEWQIGNGCASSVALIGGGSPPRPWRDRARPQRRAATG